MKKMKHPSNLTPLFNKFLSTNTQKIPRLFLFPSILQLLSIFFQNDIKNNIALNIVLYFTLNFVIVKHFFSPDNITLNKYRIQTLSLYLIPPVVINILQQSIDIVDKQIRQINQQEFLRNYIMNYIIDKQYKIHYNKYKDYYYQDFSTCASRV
eukprot:TRINITY_DN6954_c0_g1_i1.p3 TRINITY_DN6954_c0_g1~~TRINITY_DN6954_c0_g1_i1.p3  ORF type:complete len:153 (-),score=2.67 TRINITY_DN6954_c0_g1_i1:24-482(-)